MIRFAFIAFLLATAGLADTVVAVRTIPAQSIITPDDIALRDLDAGVGESDPKLFIGMEARVALYAGRPIQVSDVGFPAIVERNQIVPLIFDAGGLMIRTEGRALGRAGVGEILRVMNIASRNTVTATVGEDGAAYVSPRVGG